MFGLCQAVSHGAGFVWALNCGGGLKAELYLGLSTDVKLWSTAKQLC